MTPIIFTPKQLSVNLESQSSPLLIHRRDQTWQTRRARMYQTLVVAPDLGRAIMPSDPVVELNQHTGALFKHPPAPLPIHIWVETISRSVEVENVSTLFMNNEQSEALIECEEEEIAIAHSIRDVHSTRTNLELVNSANVLAKRIEALDAKYKELKIIYHHSADVLYNYSRFNYLFRGDLPASRRWYGEATQMRRRDSSTSAMVNFPPAPWSTSSPLFTSSFSHLNSKYLLVYKHRVAYAAACSCSLMCCLFLLALVPCILSPLVVAHGARPAQLRLDLALTALAGRSLELADAGVWHTNDTSKQVSLEDRYHDDLKQISPNLKQSFYISKDWFTTLFPLTAVVTYLDYPASDGPNPTPYWSTRTINSAASRVASAAHALGVGSSPMVANNSDIQLITTSVAAGTPLLSGSTLFEGVKDHSDTAKSVELWYRVALGLLYAAGLLIIGASLLPLALCLGPIARTPARLVSRLVVLVSRFERSDQLPFDNLVDFLDAAGYSSTALLSPKATDDSTVMVFPAVDIPARPLSGTLTDSDRTPLVRKIVTRESRTRALLRKVQALGSMAKKGDELTSFGPIHVHRLKRQHGNTALLVLVTMGTLTMFVSIFATLFGTRLVFEATAVFTGKLSDSILRESVMHELRFDGRELALGLDSYPLPDPSNLQSDLNTRDDPGKLIDSVTSKIDTMWALHHSCLSTLDDLIRVFVDTARLADLDHLYFTKKCIRTAGSCVDSTGAAVWPMPHPSYTPSPPALEAGMETVLEKWSFHFEALIFDPAKMTLDSATFGQVWDVGEVDLAQACREATALIAECHISFCVVIALVLIAVVVLGCLGQVTVFLACTLQYLNKRAQYLAAEPVLHLLPIDVQRSIAAGHLRIAKHFSFHMHPTPSEYGSRGLSVLHSPALSVRSNSIAPSNAMAPPQPSGLSVHGKINSIASGLNMQSSTIQHAGPTVEDSLVGVMVVGDSGQIIAADAACQELLGTDPVGQDVGTVLIEADTDPRSFDSDDYAVGDPLSGGVKMVVRRYGPVFHEQFVDTSVLDANNVWAVTLRGLGD
ncbi:hypothetical protein J8273_5525 [Carpediemonas membranifera]|uniref:Uncharacterized protein n=1 Tax=Carpediemonas membranifera TaxID=201153 RepID=A0A8J6AVC7_9EUKA|nr:hypothetical protein J8273_5525 [Carpediemonas membranifera]|eukprot:KAG9392520.1 hypothetical protein J8273_5525 [Carpediemonas membranifera]